MPATGIVRITDTLQCIPKAFAFPKTTTEDYLQKSIGDIIAIMIDPKRHFLFFPMLMQKNAINYISQILQISTAQTRIPITHTLIA